MVICSHAVPQGWHHRAAYNRHILIIPLFEQVGVNDEGTANDRLITNIRYSHSPDGVVGSTFRAGHHTSSRVACSSCRPLPRSLCISMGTTFRSGHPVLCSLLQGLLNTSSVLPPHGTSLWCVLFALVTTPSRGAQQPSQPLLRFFANLYGNHFQLWSPYFKQPSSRSSLPWSLNLPHSLSRRSLHAPSEYFRKWCQSSGHKCIFTSSKSSI